jgi:hypothetical protein
VRLGAAIAVLAAILAARAEPAKALSCAAPPGAPRTEREQIRAADVVVEAVALSGPRTSGYLHAPVRMVALRYLKGSGPRVLRVDAGVQPSLGGDYVGMIAGAPNPTPGERWRLFEDLPGRRRLIRSGELLGADPCMGTRILSRRLRAVPGARRVRSPGGAAWRLAAQRGPHRIRCLTARRTDRRSGRSELPRVRRACERIREPARSALLTVEHHSEAKTTASTLVAASGPGLRELEVVGPDGTLVAAASGRGRIAAIALDGYVPEAELPVTLRFAGGRTVRSQGDSARRVGAADPQGDARWSARTLRHQGRGCAEFEQVTPRFNRPRDWLGGDGTCGTIAGDGLFFEVIRPRPLASDTRVTRTVLVGAAGPSVQSVTVRSPGGEQVLPLARRGRAFLSVHPESVGHGDLAVEVLYADGSRAVFSGQRRVR